MTRSQNANELPEPIRAYLADVSRLQPPLDLLRSVMAEVDALPPRSRFSAFSVLGVAAATVLVAAVVALGLVSGALQRVGTDESARPLHSPTTLPDGVVPIRSDPPLSSVPSLDAELTRLAIADAGRPVLVAHGSVWLSNQATGQFTRVDASSGEVTAVIEANPDPPEDARWDQLAVADDRWVYATGIDETIVQIDPLLNEVVNKIPIETVAYRLEMYLGNLYLTDLDGQSVMRVDPAMEHIAWRVRAGMRPGGLKVTEDGVWVALYGDSALLRLDRETGETIEEYDAFLYGMDIIYDGDDALYITGNQGRPVERFSISEGRVTARIHETGAVALHDDDLYALRHQGELVQLDSRTLGWEQLVDLETPEVGWLVDGEGALWTSSPDELVKIEPSP